MKARTWVEYYNQRPDLSENPLEISEMVFKSKAVTDSFLRHEEARLVSLLQPDKKQDLLDLGCCAGVCLFLLAKHFRKATGVDLAEKPLEVARRWLPSCRFILDDITTLKSIPDHSCRFVTVYGVLHYMSPAQHKKLFRTLARICKKSARVLLVRIPNPKYYEEYQDWRFQKGGRRKKSRLRWAWIQEKTIVRQMQKTFEVIPMLPPAATDMPLKAFFDCLLIKK